MREACVIISLSAKPSHVTGYGDWLAQHGNHVLIPLRLGRRMTMQVAIPLPVLLGMFDLFYGGTGAPGKASDTLTGAELRFADRMATRLAAMLTTAWSVIEQLMAEPGTVALAAQAPLICRSNDPVLVQPYALSDAPYAAGDIYCLYPLPSLRAALGPAQDDGIAAAGQGDAEWSARINAAALNLRLPVRTIFARPEISFARLLSLKTGDIIPLLLPQHVPVTVAGRPFALGSIGEANGRAAIKIEKMQEGY